jgi:Holliday junction resolvase RusA-like endonuclease
MKIIIPGRPIAKKRHRTFVKQLKNGKFFQGAYNEQKPEENEFISFIKTQIPQGFIPMTEPVYIQFWFGVRRPKAHYGTGRNSGKLKESAPKYPGKKPDFDNFEKFVADCFSGVVYRDDSQIVSWRGDKRYSESPRTEIEIRRII